MESSYWLIKWNANAKKGGKRSSRMFRTFFNRPELFEAYGYNKADVVQFEKVKEDDQIFCYQRDEGKIVGLCEVKAKENAEQNGVGGRCLVLRAKIFFLAGCKWTKSCGNIYELSEEEARAVFKGCGLEWPVKPTITS